MIESDKHADAEVGTRPSVSAEVWPAVAPLKLQPDAEQSEAVSYLLDELLRYHDRSFVAHVYAALAKRAPTTAELERTLDDLRSGRRGKVEIIEELLATRTNGQPTVHVEGLRSPVLRRLSRWPLVGYVLRLLLGLVRLPVMMRHQQQFETYAMGQQQLIADYLNKLLVPAFSQHAVAAPHPDVAVPVGDTVEGVMMLSDSLIEVSAQQAELQVQLQKLQAQREESEAQLHADLVAFTEALTAQQQQLGELRREQDVTAAAQREFLVEEQRLIVEAQKLALGQLEEQLRAVTREQEEKRAELTAEVRRLRTLVEPLSSGAQEHLTGPERDQV